MIQRIQSIWLLLAAVFAAITFRFPFYNGDWLKDTVQAPVNLDATTTPWLTIVTAFVGVLAFLTIFFYGNRKTQLRLTYVGILLTVVMLVLYFLELENFASGSITLWSIFYFAILGFYYLAARGIWKDQKLIRSLDRLR
jgi:phosphatidylserine synthase